MMYRAITNYIHLSPKTNLDPSKEKNSSVILENSLGNTAPDVAIPYKGKRGMRRDILPAPPSLLFREVLSREEVLREVTRVRSIRWTEQDGCIIFCMRTAQPMDHASFVSGANMAGTVRIMDDGVYVCLGVILLSFLLRDEPFRVRWQMYYNPSSGRLVVDVYRMPYLGRYIGRIIFQRDDFNESFSQADMNGNQLSHQYEISCVVH